MNEEKKETKSSSFLRFDTIALILGFIVDAITIVSIVLAIQIPEVTKNLPNFISPGLAFALWVLAVYVYFGFLRSVWDKHQAEKKFSDKFSLFLADDLLFSFRYPALLFPAVVALVILFWIASTDSSAMFLAFVVFVLLFGGIPFLMWLRQYVTDSKTVVKKAELKQENTIPQEFKERVSKEWRFLSSQINELLAQQTYVDCDDLVAISTVWEVPPDYMNYVLVQFAIKNPRKTKFASLNSRRYDYSVNGGEKVLINLETIDESPYYHA
jgi:hypothetical protein